MTNPNTEFDTPWKDILETYFPDFIAFFFPNIYPQIDWNKGFEFLDKELQKVVKDAELGKRLADKLVKVYLINGEEIWVLIHIEVQSQTETDFAERIFIYNYRIYDRYRRPVASLVVLGDEDQNWRPNEFTYELFGSKMELRFPIIKLLDYHQQWSSLEENINPFSTVVMAHLKALETRSDRLTRKEWKLILTKRLYDLGMKKEDVINLFRFIDWMMTLPRELELQFNEELDQFQEDKKMPYVTSIERIAMEKGMSQLIELLLNIKFGEEGLTLLPQIKAVDNQEKLKEIFTKIELSQSLDEVINFLNN
jgi:hypothetical protein